MGLGEMEVEEEEMKGGGIEVFKEKVYICHWICVCLCMYVFVCVYVLGTFGPGEGCFFFGTLRGGSQRRKTLETPDPNQTICDFQTCPTSIIMDLQWTMKYRDPSTRSWYMTILTTNARSKKQTECYFITKSRTLFVLHSSLTEL